VKETKTPDPKGNAGVEHVFGTTDEVPSEKQHREEINRIQGLENQKAGSLPGKYKRTVGPESDADQKIPNIAEVEEILRAVMSPIHGHPNCKCDRPCDLQPQWHGEIIATALGCGRWVLASEPVC
jgi:hypothetical protein